MFIFLDQHIKMLASVYQKEVVHTTTCGNVQNKNLNEETS